MCSDNISELHFPSTLTAGLLRVQDKDLDCVIGFFFVGVGDGQFEDVDAWQQVGEVPLLGYVGFLQSHIQKYPYLKCDTCTSTCTDPTSHLLVSHVCFAQKAEITL